MKGGLKLDSKGGLNWDSKGGLNLDSKGGLNLDSAKGGLKLQKDSKRAQRQKIVKPQSQRVYSKPGK